MLLSGITMSIMFYFELTLTFMNLFQNPCPGQSISHNTHGLAVMSEDDIEADTLYDMVGLTHSSCK